mgnify:CR=1 FL=1
MPKKKAFHFAEAFQELEELTQWFDSQAQVDLDEGLKKFERGLALAAELKKKLQDVEQKVQEIKEKFA